MFRCATGIDASNLPSIFEEHVVLPNLDPFQPINCSFGLKDKVFNFGTLIAQLPDLAELTFPDLASGATPRDGPGAKMGGRPSMSAKQAARASIAPRAAAADGAQVPVVKPAAAQPDTGSLLDDPAATKANLKFINPKKVPCTVNFSITPTNGAQPGKWPHPKQSMRDVASSVPTCMLAIWHLQGLHAYKAHETADLLYDCQWTVLVQRPSGSLVADCRCVQV